MVRSQAQSQPAQSLIQKDSQALQRLRHTSAHILAMAVQTLFPETKVTIGPTTDNGFYYDFDRKQPFTPEDLSKIEAEMRRIIQANLPVICEVVEREQIRDEIAQLGEPYKLEILNSIPEGGHNQLNLPDKICYQLSVGQYLSKLHSRLHSYHECKT